MTEVRRLVCRRCGSDELDLLDPFAGAYVHHNVRLVDGSLMPDFSTNDADHSGRFFLRCASCSHEWRTRYKLSDEYAG
jgi:hypothetical protein